jgi:hypothetical protein
MPIGWRAVCRGENKRNAAPRPKTAARCLFKVQWQRVAELLLAETGQRFTGFYSAEKKSAGMMFEMRTAM